MNYPQVIKDIYYQQDGLFGTIAVLSPPIANYVRDGGFETVEKFKQWVTGADPNPAAKPKGQANAGLSRPMEEWGSGPGGQFSVVVTGSTNNNYFMMGAMIPLVSVQIDRWR